MKYFAKHPCQVCGVLVSNAGFGHAAHERGKVHLAALFPEGSDARRMSRVCPDCGRRVRTKVPHSPAGVTPRSPVFFAHYRVVSGGQFCERSEMEAPLHDAAA